MSTTAALIEGHWITARYPDAACQCGAQFEWNDRDKAHALHLLDVVRAEERARTDMWAATAGDYLALILPLLSGGERVSFEATGALPRSLAGRIARDAHEATVRAEERERIARNIVRELGEGRAADLAREGA